MKSLNFATFFNELVSQHLLAVLLICCLFLMLWAQIRLRGLKNTINVKSAQQNEQLMLILQTLQQSKQLSDQSQQQFQQ